MPGATVEVFVRRAPQAELFAKLKAWPQAELERFACKLLVLAQPGFHGSKVIHYAAGEPKKLIDNVTRDL